MSATRRPTAASTPRTPTLPPSGSRAARLAVVSWTVVVSAGLAALGTAAPQRPTVPDDRPAQPGSALVHTVTAAASTTVAAGTPAGTAATSRIGTTSGTGTTSAPASAAPSAQMQMQPAAFTTALPDARARTAIATAMAQIGLPYVWGGNGPAAGDAGFDCSGLTTFSYAAAGVSLPRTAHTQYYAGPHVPAGAALQPGDLVFYGTAARVHHVGMYIGAGRMVNAPTFGKPVQTAYYRWTGDDYLGATRPAASGSTLEGLLITVPEATQTAPRTTVFAAPPAPLPATPLPDPTVPQPPEAVTAAAAVAKTELPVTPTVPAPPVVGLEPTTPPVTAADTPPTTTAAASPVPPVPASTEPTPPSSDPAAPAPVPSEPVPVSPAAPSPDPAPPAPPSSPSPAPPAPAPPAPTPAPAQPAPVQPAPAQPAPPPAPPAPVQPSPVKKAPAPVAPTAAPASTTPPPAPATTTAAAPAP